MLAINRWRHIRANQYMLDAHDHTVPDNWMVSHHSSYKHVEYHPYRILMPNVIFCDLILYTYLMVKRCSPRK
jgi:hypothetical protein